MLRLLGMAKTGEERLLDNSRRTRPHRFCVCTDQNRCLKRWQSLCSLWWDLYSLVYFLVMARRADQTRSMGFARCCNLASWNDRDPLQSTSAVTSYYCLGAQMPSLRKTL